MSLFTVSIRRNIGKPIRPEAEQLEGKTFEFQFGWVMDDNDPYPNEAAWLPCDPNYPADGPAWIAGGDLMPCPFQAGRWGFNALPLPLPQGEDPNG